MSSLKVLSPLTGSVWKIEVQDFPVTVAVDSEGQNVHVNAPMLWQKRIKDEGLLAGV